MSWLKHAFSTEPSEPQGPTESQRAVIDKLCAEVKKRKLIMPSLIFLETVRPLSYVGAQTMHFFAPVMSAVVNSKEYNDLAQFLEQRDSIEFICKRLEELDRKT